MRNSSFISFLCLMTAILGWGASASEEGPMIVCKRALLPGPKTLADSQGNTELHRAILRADQPLIAQLVQSGAVLNIRNSEARTPLDLALLSDKEGVLLSFLKAVFHVPEQDGEITSGVIHPDNRMQMSILPDSELTKVYGGSLMGYLVKKWRKNFATRKEELRDVLDYLQMQSHGLFKFQAGPAGESGLYYAIEDNDFVATDLLMLEGLDPHFVGEVDKGAIQSLSPAQLAFQKLQTAEHKYVMARATEDPSTVLHFATRFAEAQAIWRRIAPKVDHRSATQTPLYQ